MFENNHLNVYRGNIQKPPSTETRKVNLKPHDFKEFESKMNITYLLLFS
jgi:hypothetical protein